LPFLNHSSEYFYSACSSLLLLRDPPDCSIDDVSKRCKQLRAKALPKGPYVAA